MWFSFCKNTMTVCLQCCSPLTVCGHSSRCSPSGSPPDQNVWCCTPSHEGSSEACLWNQLEALDLLWSAGRDSPPLCLSGYQTGQDLKRRTKKSLSVKSQNMCLWKETVHKTLCSCSPAANSSMVMRGKRMSVRAFPRTFRLFSGVGWSCCLWASASAQRTAAPNKRTSLTPSVSRSNTATNVSKGGEKGIK